GPTRTEVTMNVEPLISVLAAYLILGQAITIVQSLGIIGVVSGIVLMSYTRSD
ncbi:MAG: EamA family transporter, partial [Rhodospirillaceae bacterium]|nr:EamA family transporter [Rhodospirillaceae bacterium]